MLLGLTPAGTKCRASYHTCVTRLGTIIAVLILGFGIGANRATFSLIDTVLLRPLPNYVEPEKMMAIYMPSESAANEGFDYPDYLDYATVQHTFTALS